MFLIYVCNLSAKKVCVARVTVRAEIPQKITKFDFRMLNFEVHRPFENSEWNP